jgi:hypothetical protein
MVDEMMPFVLMYRFEDNDDGDVVVVNLRPVGYPSLNVACR